MSTVQQSRKPSNRSATLMAPTSFFSKLVKSSPTTPKNPDSFSNSHSNTRGHSPSRRQRAPSLPSSVSSERSNPDVLVVPPSPSDNSSLQPAVVGTRTNSRGESRPLTMFESTNLKTPTPLDRPSGPIRHSSSLTNLRSGDEAEVVPSGDRSRSTTVSSQTSGHSRAATDGRALSPRRINLDNDEQSPSSFTGTMSPIVESPRASRSDFFPYQARQSRQPQPRVESLLAPSNNDDAASVYSVSTGKKKRPWRRDRSREPAAATSPERSRKPHGLASAIASSGMAIANPSVTTSHAAGSITSTPTRAPRRSASISSINGGSAGRHNISAAHAPRPSLDLTPNGAEGPEGRPRVRSISSQGSHAGTEESTFDDEDDSDDELDLDDDIPVTGFAVASTRRNIEFHEMFPTVPEGDYLIEDYGCALAREILVQGRLYISENHLCFHANIFGWVTDLVLQMNDVMSLDKKMTAIFIPNAIQITTKDSKHTFASFMARDTAFDVIYNVWRLARPPGSINPSMEDVTGDTTRTGMDGPRDAGSGPVASKSVKKVTACECGKKGEHYPLSAMDAVLPGTPEKIYNLMFASGFIKDFMRDNQKLMDIQISDWQPDPATKMLSRNMSYIKPLNGSIGPKQTKCELKDETVHFEVDDYISTVTTTRTPDVPSGNVFSVKTRTCIMWASALTTKVTVTTQVEWTGRSFIKGIIERSAIDGQNTYHVALDQAMRAYIHDNRSEFIPEGFEAESIEATAEAETPAHEGPAGGILGEDTDLAKKRERERSQRSLQWAYDTFEGVLKVARTSTEGAIDLISDAWDQSSMTTLLYFVITLLVLSNAWTLAVMGRREEVGRLKGMRAAEERERLVRGVVAGLREELVPTRPGVIVPPVASGGAMEGELVALNAALDAVQDRINGLRKSITESAVPAIVESA